MIIKIGWGWGGVRGSRGASSFQGPQEVCIALRGADPLTEPCSVCLFDCPSCWLLSLFFLFKNIYLFGRTGSSLWHANSWLRPVGASFLTGGQTGPPPALGAQSLSHWTPREIHHCLLFILPHIHHTHQWHTGNLILFNSYLPWICTCREVLLMGWNL